MHAVGDGPDGHLGLVEARPQFVEHAAADLAVQQRDAVGALGQAEAHDGHVEDRRVAALVVLGAEREEVLAKAAKAREVATPVLEDVYAKVGFLPPVG